MDSPETPPPGPQPEKKARAARIAGMVRKILMVVGIVVAVLIYFGNKIRMGTRYKVSDKESVNYLQGATESDAQKLGEILKANGYFDGSKKVDVLLKKEGGTATIVSFVISGLGKDDGIEKAFRQIGENIAQNGFGYPLTIRLVDSRLKTLKDLELR